MSSAVPPPSISTTSLSNTKSFTFRSSNTPSLHIKTVVTAPPWAHDEPPTPSDDHRLTVSSENLDTRPSDSDSLKSSEAGPSRWWTFTRPYLPNRGRVSPQVPADPDHDLTSQSLTERSNFSPSTVTVGDVRQSEEQKETMLSIPRAPRLFLNSSEHALHTVPSNKSHTWDSPWSERPLGNRDFHHRASNEEIGDQRDQRDYSKTWKKRRNRLRVFLLTNPYVPLLFRFINITFTTCALVIAIRIRVLEQQNNLRGVVGVSPLVAIIIAPLTLVHVMIAVYLEYFGRPLGLWHTSGKLAHTLSETLFICAWSATLSLCFENYFTSVVSCTTSATVLSNRLSLRSILESRGVTAKIADHQLALTILVAFGLIMYCMNLIISLYRIFEKVKYLPANPGIVR